MNAQEEKQRLRRLLDLVDRENEHLQGVRHRLLGDDCRVDASRATTLLSEDIGIDRLESFGAKFGRMQDTVVDKLVPSYRAIYRGAFVRVSGIYCGLRSLNTGGFPAGTVE